MLKTCHACGMMQPAVHEKCFKCGSDDLFTPPPRRQKPADLRTPEQRAQAAQWASESKDKAKADRASGRAAVPPPHPGFPARVKE